MTEEEIPIEWKTSEKKTKRKNKPINPFRKRNIKTRKTPTFKRTFNFPRLTGLRWITARLLFLFYIILSIYSGIKYPYGLLIFIPTLFVFTDYIAKIEKREPRHPWDDEDE